MATNKKAIYQLSTATHVLLYILETSLQLYCGITLLHAPSYFIGHNTAGYITICTALGVPCFINAISCFWIFRTMDFTGQKLGIIICALFHLILLCPLWRFFKIFVLGEHRDVKEFFMLRTIQTSLQSPIFIITQGYMILAYYKIIHISIISGIILLLFSLSLTYLCYSCISKIELSKIDSFANKDDTNIVCNKNICTGLKLLSKFSKHIFMLISRLLAMTLLCSVWKAWSLTLIPVHILLYLLLEFIFQTVLDENVSVISRTKTERVTSTLIRILAEIFDYICVPSRTNKYVSSYYMIILLENSLMAIAWYFTQNGDRYDDTLLVLVFAFYIIGAIACVFSVGILCDSLTSFSRTKNTDLEVNNNNSKSKRKLFFTKKKAHLQYSVEINESNIKENELHGTEKLDFDMDIQDILTASNVFVDKISQNCSSDSKNPDLHNQVSPNEQTVTKMSLNLEQEPIKCISYFDKTEISLEPQTSSESGIDSKILDNLSINTSGQSDKSYQLKDSSSSTLTPVYSTEYKTCQIKMESSSCSECTNCTPSSNSWLTRDLENNPEHQYPRYTPSPSNLYLSETSIQEAMSKCNYPLDNLNSGDSPSANLGYSNLGYETDFTSCTSDSSYAPNSRRMQLRRSSRDQTMTNIDGKNIRSREFLTPPRLRKNNYGNRCSNRISLSSSSTTERSPSKPIFNNLEYSKQLFYGAYSSSETSESSYDSLMTLSQTSSSSSLESSSEWGSEKGLASTWPPRRKGELLCLAHLPKEQIPSKERIQKWLSTLPHDTDNEGTMVKEAVDENCDLAKRKFRFDTFRDVNQRHAGREIDSHEACITYINYEKPKHQRTRSLSEKGYRLIQRSSSFLQMCGLGLTKRKKWMNKKVNKFSQRHKRSRRVLILKKKPGTNTESLIVGIESTV